MKIKKKIFILSLILCLLLGGYFLVKRNSVSPLPKEPVVVEPIEEPEKIETVSMISVGDLMYHVGQISPISTDPLVYPYDENFTYIKKYIERADLAFANYETTSTPTREYAGYPRFNAPVQTLDNIKDTGFDVLSLVNNHTLDTGRQGVIDTYNAVNERGMIPLGTKTEPGSFLKSVTKNDIKIGMLAYSYGFNGLEFELNAEEHEYMVSHMEEEKIEREIKESIASGNDFTIVMIHWGNEYHTQPSQQQKDLAAKMSEWGADVILGSHPHVVQPTEMIGDTLVVYSMGNLISGQRLETLDDINTERGLMVEFEFEKNFKTNEKKIKNIEYHPTWMSFRKEDGRGVHQVIHAKDMIDGVIEPTIRSGTYYRVEGAYYDTMELVSGE